MVHKATVTPSLPLPWRPDGWQNVRAPKGLTITRNCDGAVTFTVEDEAHSRALEFLASELAERTNGVLEVAGQQLRPNVEKDDARFFAELAAPVDADEDAERVLAAVRRIESWLDSASDEDGGRAVRDPQVLKTALEEGDSDAPTITIAKPCDPDALSRLEAAVVAKCGVPLPKSFRKLLEHCDGISVSWSSWLNSASEVLEHSQEHEAPIFPFMGDYGEGPALLILPSRTLVVDVWHEELGGVQGEEWPVLATSFGAWFEQWCGNHMTSEGEATVYTPFLPDWTDEAIEMLWERAVRGEFVSPFEQPEVTPVGARPLALSALAEGRYEEAARFARLNQTFRPDWPRATYVLASASFQMGQARAARTELESLLERWLDEAPATPPDVHPRLIIEREELIELVTSVLGDSAASIVERIEQAGPVPESDDEFL